MSLRKFLISPAFFISLIVAICLVVGLVLLAFNRLGSYTQHGITYEVPDFSGMTFLEAEKIAQSGNIKVQVLDSVYNKNVKPGAIVEQVPGAKHRVKDGRVILLTLNSMEPEKVTLPKLTDISFRQAQVLLDNCGLFIDSISYRPSEYNDLVLVVRQDSTEVVEGDRLVKGSLVDLVVGQSRGNMEIALPDLNGLFVEEAKATLTDSRLNLGVIIYDNSIKTQDDTLNARIWKQMPDARLSRKVTLGASVDLWLTIDEEKLEPASVPGM